MPTPIAVLSWVGTERNTAVRRPVSTSTAMITPSITTRPMASAQVIRGAISYATSALTPSPAASASGNRPTTPIRIVITPATSAVAAASAANGKLPLVAVDGAAEDQRVEHHDVRHREEGRETAPDLPADRRAARGDLEEPVEAVAGWGGVGLGLRNRLGCGIHRVLAAGIFDPIARIVPDRPLAGKPRAGSSEAHASSRSANARGRPAWRDLHAVRLTRVQPAATVRAAGGTGRHPPAAATTRSADGALRGRRDHRVGGRRPRAAGVLPRLAHRPRAHRLALDLPGRFPARLPRPGGHGAARRPPPRRRAAADSALPAAGHHD